jgi:hypothetical protein
MADWKTTVRVGDLHESHENGAMTIAAVAKSLATRLRKNRFSEDLSDVIGRLGKARSVRAYDSCLKVLYDFGDNGHRIWFDSARR